MATRYTYVTTDIHERAIDYARTTTTNGVSMDAERNNGKFVIQFEHNNEAIYIPFLVKDFDDAIEFFQNLRDNLRKFHR